MQLKPIAVMAVLLLVVASLSVAGCTVTNTGNQSSTQTQSPSSLYQIKTTTTNATTNATSNAITKNYTRAGYDIVKPFAKGINQYGNDVYFGVVKDNSSLNLSSYEHNITIEIMKNNSETLKRGAQLTDFYVKQGYSITNLTNGVYFISRSGDLTAEHPLVITLEAPGQANLPYLFNRFVVAVDSKTKLG